MDNITLLSEDIDHGCCGYMKKKDLLINKAESQEQEIVTLKECKLKLKIKLEASESLVEELLKLII